MCAVALTKIGYSFWGALKDMSEKLSDRSMLYMKDYSNHLRINNEPFRKIY